MSLDAAGLSAWAAAASTLSALGFQRTAPRGLDEPDAWLLDTWATPDGYPGWLRELARRGPGPEPADSGDVARDALVAFGRPEVLEATQAMEYYRTRHQGRGGSADLQAWILDAVRSSPLSELQRKVLLIYYVEQGTSHEALAERLQIPRATYYRLHRSALDSMGSALFAT
jgi:hypothetical protein